MHITLKAINYEKVSLKVAHYNGEMLLHYLHASFYHSDKKTSSVSH